MKRLYLTALLAVVFSIAFGQFSTYEWSNRTGTASTAVKALVDGGGNVYTLVSAVPPATIAGTLYPSVANSTGYYLVKYNSAGAVQWSRELKFMVFNMALTSDSASLLLCGFLQSNYANVDMGSGVTVGNNYYSAGIIIKVDGSNATTTWARSYDPTLPAGSTAVRIDAVYERANRIFCQQGLKLRRLDAAGNEVWNTVVTANGTGYKLENPAFNSFADDDGNSFWVGVSGNGNTSTVTINGTAYTTFATNNVCRTYFSLDANGATNWVRPNVNFQPGKNVEVSAGGDVVMSGSNPYSGSGGETNHPFMPNYCNADYNVFRANLKTGVPVWNAYVQAVGNINSSGFHLAADGNLYVLGFVQSSAGLYYTVGTTARAYTPSVATPNVFLVRINAAGVPDSAVTVNGFSGTSVTQSDFAVLNFYRTAAGKLVMFFNKKNNAMNFANGDANQNASTTAYQGLVQLVPPILPARHSTAWTGATDANWFTTTNWSNGLPTDSSNAVFPAGAPNYPSVWTHLYNSATAKWAACGNLEVQPGATLYFGYSNGAKVSGLIRNEGTLIYQYWPGYSGNPFYAWNQYLGAAYVVGRGTLRITGPDGCVIPPFKTGNNTLEVNLTNVTDKVLVQGCTAFKNLALTKGNLSFEFANAGYQFYVDSAFTAAPASRIFGGAVNAVLRNNASLTLPTGDATNPQPATLSLFNSTAPVYLKASFSATVTGSAPNPATCVVNGQSISSVLNGGQWTVTASSALPGGAYYNAVFRLKGSTNAASANRYALLKRPSSAGAWAPAGSYQPAKDSGGYAVSGGANITSFSDFAIGIANQALPIFSVKLSAAKGSSGNRLNWEISAAGGDRLHVEKSGDGRSFVALASLPFSATGTHTDAAPQGKTFYRLKVTNRQGAVKYSNVVWIDGDGKGVTVYPTVFSRNFFAQNDGGTPLALRLYSSSGILVLSQTLRTGTNAIEASHLTPGVYWYQTESGSGALVKE